MLIPESAKERIFCPHCGKDGAYDATGEDDWFCSDKACAERHSFISPLFERDLQGKELIRLRMENEQLKTALRMALAKE